MPSDREREIERICQAALERSSGDRAGFLAEACGGDEVLRRQVERLLAQESAAGSFLETPALACAANELVPTSRALTAGTQLGSYTILSPLGAGGMGEVYRARDATLRRDVAIKVLPAMFTGDPERLSRFEREARMLASLNHPNIATIHGVERIDGLHALVLEVVEGTTLAERLAAVRKGLPLPEALAIARQLADALEAAHEHGIVHRDLKPANIKIRPDGVVKVLDFGLAKAVDPGDDRSSVGAVSRSPTLTITAARDGVLLGTPAYMSPEQARGLPVDKRADVWAFGCVLYEMLTGAPAFAGDRTSDVLARIIEREPAFDALPAGTPDVIRRLLRRCLEKNPQDRLRSIGDAGLDIREALTRSAVDSSALSTRGGRRTLRWAVTSLVGVSVALAVWLWTRPEPVTFPSLVRFSIIPSPAAPLVALRIEGRQNVSVSADGTHFAYRSNDGFVVRSGDQLAGRLVDVPTPNHGQPFLSPDGSWLGYTLPRAIMKLPVGGGSPIMLAADGGAGSALGASWAPDDTVIFGGNNGLFRVAAAGGEPQSVLKPDRDKGDRTFGWPEFLPGGQVILFTVIGPAGLDADARIEALDLKSGERHRLIPSGSRARYVSSGHLVFASGGILHAVAFDLERLQVRGNPVPVVTSAGSADYAVSAEGTLVYLAGAAGEDVSELVWVDRDGREESLGAPPKPYTYPRLSPDTTRVASSVGGADRNIFIWDIGRQNEQLFTVNDPTQNSMVAWSHDSRRLAFSSAREGPMNMFWQAADGSGSPVRLVHSARFQLPVSFTPDGTRLLFGDDDPSGKGRDIFALSMDGQIEPIVTEAKNQGNPEVSIDGQWIAYDSDESGQAEVLVRRFPGGDGRWPISVGGGKHPLWGRGRRELFYRSPSGAMMAVPIAFVPTFTAGRPEMLFEGAQYAGRGGGARPYDLSADGQRFLMIKRGQPSADSVVVVKHWHQELKRLVPAP